MILYYLILNLQDSNGPQFSNLSRDSEFKSLQLTAQDTGPEKLSRQNKDTSIAVNKIARTA